MGMSAETFWDGLAESERLKKRVIERAKVRAAMGSDACRAALSCYGDIKKIAVVTPYWPVGDKNVHKFFSDCGYQVMAIKGLKCRSPMLIAHVQEDELRQALIELNTSGAEALIQVGTNLAMARLAAEAEKWLKKPVIAINTATYWYALRDNGIDDVVEGFGSLMTDFCELPKSYLKKAAAAE